MRADIALLANLASAPAAPAAPELKGESPAITVTWKPVDGAKRYLVGVRRGGLEFERVVEADGVEAKLTIQGEEPLAVCVAAVDARGHVSLFSPESALPIEK